MTTRERAIALAEVASGYPLLGAVTADDLVEQVRIELGHPEILDGFRPYAGFFSRAVPRGPLLHVVSGNTPHAALQSLMRGLLVGARNLVKLPSEGLVEAESFVAALPSELAELVAVGREVTPAWKAVAGVWIVFGSDETITRVRKGAPAGVVFEDHGHRVSIEVILDDPLGISTARVAEDVSRFNQKGCLSPHDVYVAGDARDYAEKLAAKMEVHAVDNPPEAISKIEAAEIMDVRANYRFRAANDARVGLWESAGTTAWTVIYEEDPWFAASCLNRTVFVKPLPGDLGAALGPALPWLAGVGIWPPLPATAERFAALGPSRICAAGRLQFPPVAWHQEGRPSLVPLVRWVDFEPDIG